MNAKNYFGIVVRTPKGLVIRGYKKQTLGEAMQAARNKSDCLDIVRTSKITEDEYNTVIANSDQRKQAYSAACRVTYQKEKATKRSHARRT